MKEITAKELEGKLANGETPNILDVREVDEVRKVKFRILSIFHLV